MSDSYEIHSILEFGDRPAPGLWWVLSPSGNSPPIRAGAEMFVRKDSKWDDSVTISGGGTPGGYINDISRLCLFRGEWQSVSKKGFISRYMHVMVSINGQDTVLLGDSDCNESIQSFNGEEWVKTELKGNIPSPRTVSQAARFKNQTYVWSGGTEKGPCSDSCVYVFDSDSIRREKLKGEIPPPLQEFAFCADDENLYIHGGLSSGSGEMKFSSDLYKINRKTFRSKRCQISGPLGARAMHKMVSFDNKLFVFGGLMQNETVSDELFVIKKTENGHYLSENTKFENKPTPRLGFNFTVLNLPVKKSDSSYLTRDDPEKLNPEGPIIQAIDDWKVTIDGQNRENPVEPQKPQIPEHSIDRSEYESIPVLFIFGGCDAQGEFFNDLYISTIPDVTNSES